MIITVKNERHYAIRYIRNVVIFQYYFCVSEKLASKLLKSAESQITHL
jgi:hypothetical protein